VIVLTHVLAVAVKFRAVNDVVFAIVIVNLTRPPDVSPVTFVTVIPRVERTDPSLAVNVQSVTIDFGEVAAVIVIICTPVVVSSVPVWVGDPSVG
jgi:hypothetical protein